MASRIILPPTNPSLDANGDPVSGATLTFYQNGTTTPQSVYSAPDLMTPLANPYDADSAGRFPEFWATEGVAYSIKWTLPGASPITYDDIYGQTSGGNFARTDEANTFTGTQTFSGEIIPEGLVDISGASAGQIKFPATQNPSSDPNTLDDYKEATAFTPTDASGASLAFTSVSAGYTKIGNMVFIYGTLTFPSTSDGSNASIGALPFPSANMAYGFAASALNVNLAGNFQFIVVQDTQTAIIIDAGNNANATNVQLSGKQIRFTASYPVA